MNQDGGGRCSGRERLEMTLGALVPAGMGLLGPIILLGGRLSWLGPLLALPVGLCLVPVWRSLGREGLERGLEKAFGRLGGRGAEALYLLWGLALLTDGARKYSERLLTVFEGEGVRWLVLLSAFGVCLLLGREEEEALGRTGRIFFLAVGTALGVSAVLGLGGIQWQNLWPIEGRDWRGLPGSGVLCLSLAGYGVYALCLPAQGETRRTWAGPVWGWGALSLLLLLVTGTFGPALGGQLEEPFLFVLEGVQPPGAFRRGDAGVLMVLTLGDLLLLSLLGRGCVALWRRLVPPFPALGWLPVGAALLFAGALPGLGRTWAWLGARLPAGNLLFGVLVPIAAVLTIRAREKRRAIFCGKKLEKEVDVAVKSSKKKRDKENEKKC